MFPANFVPAVFPYLFFGYASLPVMIHLPLYLSFLSLASTIFLCAQHLHQNTMLLPVAKLSWYM